MVPVLLYIQHVFVPVLQEEAKWLHFWTDEKIFEHYLKFSVNGTMPNDEYHFTTKYDSVLIIGFGMTFGPILLAVIPIWRGIVHLPSLADYIIRKSKRGTRMKLVIRRIKD